MPRKVDICKDKQLEQINVYNDKQLKITNLKIIPV